MFPYTFETVTALTIIVIGVILGLYFMVLKRNGWLMEKSNRPNGERAFRCPNQECREIFNNPISLTDLSQNTPTVCSACPYCGTNLDYFGFEKTSPIAVDKKTLMSFKVQNKGKSVERIGVSKPSFSNKKDKPATPLKPIVTKDDHEMTSIPATPLKPIVTKDDHEMTSIPATPLKPIVTKDDQKMTSIPATTFKDILSTCPHFFGYLRKIPKNSSIPDQCLICSKMVECISYNMT